MGIHDESMELLKEIYDCQTIQQSPYIIDAATYRKFTSETLHKLMTCMSYLKQNGFVKNYAPCSGAPVSLEITATGIQQIEHIVSQPQGANIIIHGNVSGIVGQNVSGNTIHQGISVEEFKSLLPDLIKDENDLKEISQKLDPLLKRMEFGAPLEKGLLSSAKQHLEKYQTLYAAVVQIATNYLLNK